MASAQIVEAVRWSGEEIPAANESSVDSVRLTATIQKGWHMTLINVGEKEIGEEIYASPFTLTFAANEVVPIRYNSCNDQMCTAPEVYDYSNEKLKILADQLGTSENDVINQILESVLSDVE